MVFNFGEKIKYSVGFQKDWNDVVIYNEEENNN